MRRIISIISFALIATVALAQGVSLQQLERALVPAADTIPFLPLTLFSGDTNHLGWTQPFSGLQGYTRLDTFGKILNDYYPLNGANTSIQAMLARNDSLFLYEYDNINQVLTDSIGEAIPNGIYASYKRDYINQQIGIRMPWAVENMPDGLYKKCPSYIRITGTSKV